MESVNEEAATGSLPPSPGSSRLSIEWPTDPGDPDTRSDMSDVPRVERGPDDGASARRADRFLEIAAVVLLAAGTPLAARSGYQSSLWNSIRAGEHVHGSGHRVEATRATTLAGQDRP